MARKCPVAPVSAIASGGLWGASFEVGGPVLSDNCAVSGCVFTLLHLSELTGSHLSYSWLPMLGLFSSLFLWELGFLGRHRGCRQICFSPGLRMILLQPPIMLKSVASSWCPGSFLVHVLLLCALLKCRPWLQQCEHFRLTSWEEWPRLAVAL